MSDGTIFKVQKKVASISLDEPLRRVFQGFCEGGTEMSIGQFVQFAAEKKLIEQISKAWEEAKDGIYLPRYFMPEGENNIFDGKPDGAKPPSGLPVMGRDEYGADKELGSF